MFNLIKLLVLRYKLKTNYNKIKERILKDPYEGFVLREHILYEMVHNYNAYYSPRALYYYRVCNMETYIHNWKKFENFPFLWRWYYSVILAIPQDDIIWISDAETYQSKSIRKFLETGVAIQGLDIKSWPFKFGIKSKGRPYNISQRHRQGDNELEIQLGERIIWAMINCKPNTWTPFIHRESKSIVFEFDTKEDAMRYKLAWR